MKVTYKFFLIIFLFSFWGAFGQTNDSNSKTTNEIEIKSGQVWKYKNRTGESKSRLVILKVEDYGKRGEIVHIAVYGLKIKGVKGRVTKEISHLPFDKENLLESLVELESTTDNLPEFKEGYLQWKEAFENEKAGVFTTQVKDAVDFVDKSLNQ